MVMLIEEEKVVYSSVPCLSLCTWEMLAFKRYHSNKNLHLVIVLIIARFSYLRWPLAKPAT